MDHFSRIIPISLRSLDRDRLLYPEPNKYRVPLPYPIDRVVGIQLASLELPSLNAQYTIEQDVNDRFTFSEGLRIDLGEAQRTDVDGISGNDMFNNGLTIQEDSNEFQVSVPAYLSEITNFNGNLVVTNDSASSNGVKWYVCYTTWRTQIRPTAPALQVIGGTAGYVETITASGTLQNTANNTNFTNGFVHLPALSIQEICSYLTYAFQNYTTYASSPSTPPQHSYRFEYYRGKVRCVVSLSAGASSPTLHFPMTANASQTEWNGFRPIPFPNLMELNRGGAGAVTSLGHMMGFHSGIGVSTETYRTYYQTLTSTGFHASTEPRFLFEARLPPGLYTQSDLATRLPIAMNPLHFTSGLNTTTTGACYFGFIDSEKTERVVVINEGKYTPETFCQAVSYALNRLDPNGPYFAKSRFAYKSTPLNYAYNAVYTWPDIDLENVVVYQVRYDFTTSKFVFESSWMSSFKPNDVADSPTAALDTDRPAPEFGLLFDPTTLTRIAATISGLTSDLCAQSNVDRIANVLGFEMQDYLGTPSYTSTKESWIPRIGFPLSKNMETSSRRIFHYENPDNFGMYNTGGATLGNATGAGVPRYAYPRGRYRAVGMVPTTQNLSLSVASTRPISSDAYWSAGQNTRPIVTISNHGYLATDYAVSPPGTPGNNFAPNMYLVIENVSSQPESNVIMKVNTVSDNATRSITTAEIIETGSGSFSATEEFIPISAHGNLRMQVVTNPSAARCALFSTHTNAWTSDGRACATTVPFGVQIGDVVRLRCVHTCWMLSLDAVRASITLSAPNSTALLANQGFHIGKTYTIDVSSPAATITVGSYYTVVGGHRNAIVKGTSTTEVQVVESGSGYYTAGTFHLSNPMLPYEVEGIVVHIANSGGYHADSTQAQNEQFFTSVPYLDGGDYTAVAAKTVDGATVRVRIPAGIDQYLNGGSIVAGEAQAFAEFTSPRFGIHIEDNNLHTQTKPMHANEVLGTGRLNLGLSRNLTFPNSMNVSPVPYVLVKFCNLNAIQNQQLSYTDQKIQTDIVGKIVLGAPVSIVRSLLNRIDVAMQTIADLEVEFYLPDGVTLYNFHGLDHTLTLNLVIRDAKRKTPSECQGGGGLGYM